MKTIYENEFIIIYANKHNFDFKYMIKNKTNNDYTIYFNNLDENLVIEKHNWVGLFSEDKDKIKEIIKKNVSFKKGVFEND